MDRESLILKYKKYAEKIAYIFFNKYQFLSNSIDWEDILQISYIGLINAIDTFDETKDTSIYTYIRNKVCYTIIDNFRIDDILSKTKRNHVKILNQIEFELIEQYKTQPTKEQLQIEFNKRVKNSSSNKSFLTNQSFELTYKLRNISHCDIDEIKYYLNSDINIEENFIDKDLYYKIQLLIPSLNTNEKYCIQRYFFDEIPMSKIGIELNLTDSRISQIIQESANKLKRWFNNDLVRNMMMNENNIEILDEQYPGEGNQYQDIGKRACKCGAVIPPERKVSVCAKCWGEQRHGKKKLKSKMESPQIKKSTNDKQILLDFSNDMGLLTNLKTISKNKRRTIENQILYMLDQILESQDNVKSI